MTKKKHTHNQKHNKHHSHDHTTNHSGKSQTLWIVIILNVLFALIEFTGAWWANSVAVLSDAFHDLGDVISLILFGIFARLSRKRPNSKYTFGYQRYSLIGAMVTAMVLVFGSGVSIAQAIGRLLNPEPVEPLRMVVLAIAGVVINFIAGILTHSTEGVSGKILRLHLLEDALGWIVVLITSGLIVWTDSVYLDPIISIALGIYIGIKAFQNLKSIFKIFLMKSPDNIKLMSIVESIKKIDMVDEVHDLHCWQLIDSQNIITLHVVIIEHESLTISDLIVIRESVRDILTPISKHCTVELEFSSDDCTQECYDLDQLNHKKELERKLLI